jgi:hypothetical protein
MQGPLLENVRFFKRLADFLLYPLSHTPRPLLYRYDQGGDDAI